MIETIILLSIYVPVLFILLAIIRIYYLKGEFATHADPEGDMWFSVFLAVFWPVCLFVSIIATPFALVGFGIYYFFMWADKHILQPLATFSFGSYLRKVIKDEK